MSIRSVLHASLDEDEEEEDVDLFLTGVDAIFADSTQGSHPGGTAPSPADID